MGASLRIQIRVDISRPLRRGVNITLDDAIGRSWIPIQYERLPEFCFLCGIIGHQHKNCDLFYSSDRTYSVVMNYGD